MNLNLGCGRDYREGYINVDMNPHAKADIHFDLEVVPYPNFKENSAETIICNHILEHLIHLDKVLEEMKKILKPNGDLRVIVPHATRKDCCFHRNKFHTWDFEAIWDHKDGFIKKKRPKITFDIDALIPYVYIFRRREPRNNSDYWHNYLFEFFFNLPYLMGLWEQTFIRLIFPAREIHFVLTK